VPCCCSDEAEDPSSHQGDHAPLSRGGGAGSPLHTMESLCRALYAAAPGSRTVVGGPPRTLLFHRASGRLPVVLDIFPSAERPPAPPGTFDRLIDVITALKESGVYHDILAEELALSPEGEQPKLADVASIYARTSGSLPRWMRRTWRVSTGSSHSLCLLRISFMPSGASSPGSRRFRLPGSTNSRSPRSGSSAGSARCRDSLSR